MKPSVTLHAHRDAVLAVASRNGAGNVRIFGSVLHGQDKEGSDIDLLVDMIRGTTLLDMVRLQNALEMELGVAVDVLTAGDLPPNIRQQVLHEARPL